MNNLTSSKYDSNLPNDINNTIKTISRPETEFQVLLPHHLTPKDSKSRISHKPHKIMSNENLQDIKTNIHSMIENSSIPPDLQKIVSLQSQITQALGEYEAINESIMWCRMEEIKRVYEKDVYFKLKSQKAEFDKLTANVFKN